MSVFDTTPLFKYHVRGADARALLEHVLLRDVGTCAVGRAQYTVWCDDDGYVLQDGVVLHVSDGEYWITSAEPTLHYFREVARARDLDVSVEDVTDAYGILALQGPHAHDVLGQLTSDAAPLRYFGCTETEIDGRPVIVSRTGYTGDLGYELWIRAEDALRVWDALWEAGRAYNLTPIGNTTLKMSRVEAGAPPHGGGLPHEPVRMGARAEGDAAGARLGAGCSGSWRRTSATSSGAPPSRRRSRTARVAGRPSVSGSTGTTTTASTAPPGSCLRCTRSTPSRP